MSSFEPRDPAYEARVRAIFAGQAVMATFGARLHRVEPGRVEIHLPFRPDLCQQDGYLHAGVITTVVDTACGAAAGSLMPPGAAVLTVEYKVNFMRPAAGEMMIARGEVIRPGRSLTVCRGEVLARRAGTETLVATMLTTMIQA